MSLEQARQADDELRAQRDKVLAGLTGPAREQVAKAFALAPGLWVEAFGYIGAPATDAGKLAAIAKALSEALPALPPGLATKVTDAMKGAQKLSGARAARVVPGRMDAPKPELPAEAKAATKNFMQKSARSLALSHSQLAGLAEGDTFTALTGALSFASSALNQIDAGTAYVLQDAATDAVAQVAKAAGVGVVIVGERDACLRCNDHIGQTSEDTDERPPFHPHCLCVTQPWSPKWATPGEVSFPEALRREAERSVARGFSGHDSNAARVRAAQALLNAGSQLPKSVQDYARSAVRRGAFKK